MFYNILQTISKLQYHFELSPLLALSEGYELNDRESYCIDSLIVDFLCRISIAVHRCKLIAVRRYMHDTFAFINVNRFFYS